MLSVIICTYNPREDYLRRTLAALENQTLPLDEWELLLIDNASEQTLAGQWDLSWHPNARIVREEQLGLTAARLRGIAESKASLLVFVDDDNVLQSEYLERALAIANRLPVLGCFGAGSIVPEYEIAPDAEILPVTAMLALRTVQEDRWSNCPDDDSVPWGAGLCVRRDVALRHRERLLVRGHDFNLGRAGNELLSCGDNEFSLTACAMGLGKGVFKELQVTHLIDARRIEKNYLLKIAEGHGFSHAILAATHGRPVRKSSPPPSLCRVVSALLRGRLSSFAAELQRWNVARNQSALQRDVDRAWSRGNDRAVDQLGAELR